MTPASMLARKRALLQLAGGAMPDTSEVDVSEVPVALPEETPEQAEPLPRPSAPVVMDEPQDAYGDALARQRSLQLMAGLSRAGGTAIQAISGVAPDQQAASALDEQAKAPVVEYLQRMKLADTERKRGIEEKRATRQAASKTVDLDALSPDPKSPQSIHAQGVFDANFPNRLAPEQLAKMSERDFARWKMETTAPRMEAIEAGREAQVAADKRAEADRIQRDKLAGKTLGYQYENMGHTDQRSKDALEAARIARETARIQHEQDATDAAAQDLGKETVKLGIPEALGKINDLKALFHKYQDELPGIGWAAGMIPNRFEEADSKKLRMLIGQLGATYQKSMTGTGASDAERKRYDEVTGLLQRGDSESIRLGVKMMEEDLTRKQTALEGAYKPEAVKTYRERTTTPKPVRVPVTQHTVLDDSDGTPSQPTPSRADKKLDPTKTEKSRQYSADGKWLRVNYMDGTYGLAPSDKR